MEELTLEEIGEIISDYLLLTRQLDDFKEWLIKRGYTLEELGMKNDE